MEYSGVFTTVAGGESGLLLSTRLEVTSNIQMGLTYKVRYRAANVNGWGPWSPEGLILAASVPSAPSAPAFSSATSSSIAVTLSPASAVPNGSPITTYWLQLSNDGGATFINATTSLSNLDTSYNITGLEHGAVYSLKYLAENGRGVSVSALTLVAVANPPITATIIEHDLALSNSSSPLVVKWTMAINATGY